MSEKILLVVDHDYSRNWPRIFKNAKLQDGSKIRVEVAAWKDIVMQSSSGKGCTVRLLEKEDPILPQQKNTREFSPDFLLIRNFPTDLHGMDFQNILYGFMFAGIPSVNSVKSIFLCQKPIIYGELTKLMKKLGGYDKFPLIPQTYYSNIPTSHTDLHKEESYPVVAKIGTVHAGFGKCKFENSGQFSDWQSCMMLNRQYYITEKFYNVDYDLRLQKIGDEFRVYKRSSENWKQNWGDVKYENVKDYPKHYDMWMKEIGKFFGGLDMFALDVLRLKDGSDLVLELNDTAMGIPFHNEKQDNAAIKNHVVKRMNQELCPEK